jgi:hypothetical protein
MPFRTPLLLAALVVAVQACDDPFGRPAATLSNREDSTTLYAVTGTPVFRPSAYVVVLQAPVRLDLGASFDFLFHIDPNGRPAFLPFEVLARTGRVSGSPGLVSTDLEFDAITDAEQTGYVTSDTVYIAEGQRFFVRSTVDGSCFLQVPYYAKLEVLSIDPDLRAVRFRILANRNCGYRGLEPGLPTR